LANFTLILRNIFAKLFFKNRSVINLGAIFEKIQETEINQELN